MNEDYKAAVKATPEFQQFHSDMKERMEADPGFASTVRDFAHKAKELRAEYADATQGGSVQPAAQPSAQQSDDGMFSFFTAPLG